MVRRLREGGEGRGEREEGRGRASGEAVDQTLLADCKDCNGRWTDGGKQCDVLSGARECHVHEQPPLPI